MPDRLGDTLRRLAGEGRPAIRYLERSWSAARLLDEAARLAGGLRAAGLEPGERLGIALPNLPAAVIALLACWQGGFVAAPVDPRQPVDELLDWQAAIRPRALVTLDLATVFERSAPLFQDAGLRCIAVARIADQLSPLKRLLAPWLRAGGTARAWPDERFRGWPALLGDPIIAESPPALVLPDGTFLDPATLLPPAAEPAILALPLCDPAALAALLGALEGGGALVLSPRLDTRSLDRVAKATGIARRIGTKSPG